MTQLKHAFATGQLRPTVNGIRQFLGYSQSRAIALRRQLAELNCGVRPVTAEGNPSAALRFCVQELSKGWPVIVALRTRRRTHVALAVGIEGQQSHRRFMTLALLLLDPAASEPRLAGFNARLETAKRPLRLTATATRRVTAEGAVSIRLKPP
ncbi:hypothetical protein ACU8YE_05740 [Ralstonia sp. VS2407]